MCDCFLLRRNIMKSKEALKIGKIRNNFNGNYSLFIMFGNNFVISSSWFYLCFKFYHWRQIVLNWVVVIMHIALLASLDAFYFFTLSMKVFFTLINVLHQLLTLIVLKWNIAHYHLHYFLRSNYRIVLLHKKDNLTTYLPIAKHLQSWGYLLPVMYLTFEKD